MKMQHLIKLMLLLAATAVVIILTNIDQKAIKEVNIGALMMFPYRSICQS